MVLACSSDELFSLCVATDASAYFFSCLDWCRVAWTGHTLLLHITRLANTGFLFLLELWYRSYAAERLLARCHDRMGAVAVGCSVILLAARRHTLPPMSPDWSRTCRHLICEVECGVSDLVCGVDDEALACSGLEFARLRGFRCLGSKNS